MMNVPGADGGDLLIDDGGEATILIHKGKEFGEKSAKDGSLSEQSQVKVKLPSGKTIDVPYEASTTAKQIKAEIHESQPDIAEETLELTVSGLCRAG